MNRSNIALTALFVSLSACATNPARPEGREVVTRVDLPVAPEQAVRAFLRSEDLAAWWNVSRSHVDREVGGSWAITWDDYGEEKGNYAWTGVIRALEADRVVIGDLVMIEHGRRLLAPLQLEIAAAPTATGCELQVTHSGYREGADWDWAYEVVIAGWQHALGDLESWFTAD